MKSPLLHLISALVVCVMIFIGYGVWYAVLADKSAAAGALQSQIDTKTETAARMATTRTAFAEITNDEAIVQSYFVPETGVVAFIDSIETRGRTIGASVNVLSVSTGGTSEQPTLVFTLFIKGTFDAVLRTIGAIEYAPYAISISTLSIDQDTKNAWHANLTLSVGSRAISVTATRTP